MFEKQNKKNKNRILPTMGFRILRSIYQTRTSSRNQSLTTPSSVISAPLKDVKMGLCVPATMDDELELELELEALLVHEVTANLNTV